MAVGISSRPPVPAQLRVEHLAEPVQDDRSSRLSQHARVDLKVVLGAASDRRQLTGSHHNRLRARRLNKLDLLQIGAGDFAEAAGRGDKLIGACAGGDPCAVLAGQGRASRDQLLGSRPVQTHIALRSVHGLGDPKAVAEQVAAERQSCLPVDGRRRTRDVLAAWVGHHVSRGKGDPALETLRML